MTVSLKSVLAISICGLIVAAGCQKKVTKVDEPPPPPPRQVSYEPPPPPPEPTIDYEALVRQNLTTIYFEFDRYTLTPESVRKLETAARFLGEHRNLRLMLEGHADERGSSEYNMGLGENRSRAVRNYLVNYGVESGRLEITSFGKERPVSSNCGSNDGCHGQNRRVEWRLLSR